MRSSWITVAGLAACALAAACVAAATSAPLGGAEPPAATASPESPVAPDVLAVLDKMDAAGKAMQTLRAKFDYEINQTLFNDIQKRKGELLYQAPNLLRFEFTSKPQETFVFDGRMLYHKKDATQQLIVWELRLPAEPPVDSLELGKTPFPLPFGQRKEAVLKHFTVGLDAKEQAADKDKRQVLALVPKKGTEMAKDYVKILLWIDPKQDIPTRARLFDTSENITTVDFSGIEVNKPLDAKSFTRPAVPADWETVLNSKEAGSPRPAAPDAKATGTN